MNIYIPIEIKLRELEGRALLAAVAAERGHTVILGGKEDTLALAKNGKLPPGIVHMKSLAPSEKNIATLDSLIRQGHLVTIQDEEHGLLDQSYDWFTQIRFSAETLGKVSTHFTWGNHDASALQARYPSYTEKIITTGSPRVDFWRPDFASYYRQNAPGQPGCERYQPYILIVSSFVKVLNENRIWNVIATQRKGGFFERSAEDEFRLYEISAYQTKLVKEFIQLVRQLSATFPNLKLVIRPHPVEAVDAWEKMIGHCPNLVVAREGTISGWIRQSLAIIHNSSTSALEAAACKKPCIAYRPIPSEYERVIANRLSWETYTLREVEKIINSLLRKERIDGYAENEAATSRLLKQRFANLYGNLAGDLIVDQWEKLASSHRLESSSSSTFIYKRLGSRLRSEAAIRIKDGILRFKPVLAGEDNNFKTGHKYPDLHEQEIKSLLEKLQASTGRFQNVIYRRFGRRSFILYPK